MGGRVPRGGPPLPEFCGGSLLSSYCSRGSLGGGGALRSQFLGSSGGVDLLLGGGAPILNCIVGKGSPGGGP